MITRELEQILFEEIGYAGRPELVHSPDITWGNEMFIPGIDSAVLLKKTPIAYFSRLSALDPEQIQQLHKKVWSQSKAPLLFVTLPHEIRVYNGYEPPSLPGEEFDTSSRLLQRLTDLTDHLSAQRKIREQLVQANHYERVYLETGAFWDTTESKKINPKKRADRQLIENMGQMRKLLRDAGLSNHVAYTLLGRSIFIRYLEDRGALPANLIVKMTDGQASSYPDALSSRQVTYLLFERLSERFNGDLFPIEEAEKKVSEKHLTLLFKFLNRENLETGQLNLWPYDFEHIPIELISHIYDTFIENQRSSGAYYTPLLLADFILEETMGDDVIHSEMTVLDPACGSGIFLVGAYRRLIQTWREENGAPTLKDLNRILQNNIFGVDKNREAVRIAAFSLYLEILNHLTNEQIREDSFRFPHLQEKNLLVSDFFHEEKVDVHFSGRKFDRVVGNMPWGRGSLTDLGKEWLDKREYTVGGRQAAPAFMLRAPEFCKSDGEVALLVPAKSTILVTSKTHQAFRDRFFRTYNVQAVVNFSAMRQELFGDAISPAVAIFYTPNAPMVNRKLIYGVPKPSPLSQHLKAIVLDTTEVKFLNREELLAKPYLWKVALWGTPRDFALLQRLKTTPSLETQIEGFDGIIRNGIQIKGGGKNPAPWLEGMDLVPSVRLRPFFIDSSVFETITDKYFHSPRQQKITKSPLVLIRQSKCYASFSDKDVAYNDAITGISVKGELKWLLLWLVAYINSPLAEYYHFMTSTRWAIERTNILQNEYEEMPFLIPDEDDPRLQKILQYLDQINFLLGDEGIFSDASRDAKLREYKTAINELVYELHGFHSVEQQLVEDTLEYGLGYFDWSTKKTRKPRGAKAVERPTVDMLEIYADIFARTATSFLRVKNQTLNATVYRNGAPLTVVSFEIVNPGEAQPVQVETQPDAMRLKLRELDELVLEQKTPSMYIRRHVRIYDGDQISLVRPSEQRFWTQSQARADADAFLEELLA